MSNEYDQQLRTSSCRERDFLNIKTGFPPSNSFTYREAIIMSYCVHVYRFIESKLQSWTIFVQSKRQIPDFSQSIYRTDN